MKAPMDEEKAWQLYARAIDILDGLKPGFGLPILRHLALRRFSVAMTVLADRSAGEDGNELGLASRVGSAAWMYRRAYRMGHARAAYNLAISHFNGNDLQGYRHWLFRAAKAGDERAQIELQHFQTRMEHGAARKIGRHRPWQKLDEFL
ncbi:hypothetical protein [Sphingomonas crusticola]|uniref:hypothetical protein n=1 Tax=Sphingomonas crusticola TaxID=1697973 RepID=UPI000E239175|nr:hypothetical protein [Sphingomonas crusticola]